MPEVAANLLTLTRHRWNLPVMAQLARGASRFSDLAGALQASRDSISRSLKALALPRWVQRGEAWRLTRSGSRIADQCVTIIEAAQELKLTPVTCKRWSLPIAAALQRWSLHFNELRAFLPGITPRALTLALKEMQAEGLVHREIVGGFPPAAVYRLTDKCEIYLAPVSRL